MFILFCTLSIEEMASPSEEFGDRLKETVTEGNCPWWLIESGALTRWIWVNALNGTAFAGVALLAVFEAEVLGDSAFDGAVSEFEEGVYAAEAVVLLEPADAELDEANDVDAPAPLAPEDELA